MGGSRARSQSLTIVNASMVRWDIHESPVKKKKNFSKGHQVSADGGGQRENEEQSVADEEEKKMVRIRVMDAPSCPSHLGKGQWQMSR